MSDEHYTQKPTLLEGREPHGAANDPAVSEQPDERRNLQAEKYAERFIGDAEALSYEGFKAGWDAGRAEAQATIEQLRNDLKAYQRVCSCHMCQTVRAALSGGDK